MPKLYRTMRDFTLLEF